jgi:hypothetical protein
MSLQIEELNNEDNLKAFIHALATVMPNTLTDKLINEQYDNLGFNQMATRLIFEFDNLKED